MPSPVKIVVQAQTEQAAAALQAFLQTQGIAFEQFGKKAAAAGHAAEGLFAQNRMAAMEMEHVVRSSMDALIAGINPIRALAMEAPRIAEAAGNLSADMLGKIKAFAPALGVVGVALVAGAAAWHIWGDSLIDPNKRAKELADTMGTLPDLIKKIETARLSGAVTDQMAQKYVDMLSGKTPLYFTLAPDFDPLGKRAKRIGTGILGLTGDQIPQVTDDPIIRGRGGRQTGTRSTPDIDTNTQDKKDYVEYRMRQDKATMANNEANPGLAADVELKKQEKQLKIDAEVGDQKEIDRIKLRVEEKQKELELNKKIESAAGTWTPAKDTAYSAAMTNAATEGANSIAEIQQRAADETARKNLEIVRQQAEAEKQLREAALKDGQLQIANLEESITTEQARAGEQRGALALREYTDRVTLYVKLAAQGKMTEEEYVKAVTAAQRQATAAAHEYEAQLQRIRHLERETAQDKTEAQLQLIKENPELTSEQKKQQSLPLYQQQLSQLQSRASADQTTADTTSDPEQKADALRDYWATQIKIEQAQTQINESTKTWMQTFSDGLTGLQNHFGTFAQDLANFGLSGFKGMSTGLTEAFEQMAYKGDNFRKFMGTVTLSIEKSMLQSASQMASDWIMTHVVMAAATAAWHGIETASQAAATSAQVGIHTAGETAKTGATAAGAGSRAGIGVMETIWHGIQTALKVVIHIAGQIAMTAVTFIQAALRRAIAFIEIQPMIVLAGIEAAAAVAGIPIVGPILAPIAAVATIATLEGLAAFADGGRPKTGQVALVGERGPELFVPDTAGTIIPADKTEQMLQGGNGFSAGGMGSNHTHHTTAGVYFDRAEMVRQLEKSDAHEKLVVDIMQRNAYKFA